MLLGLGLNRGGVMAWKSGQSYSADLRSRVLAAVDGGLPRPICKRLVRVWLSSLRQRIRPVGTAVAKMEIRALRS
jgi:hypothetical protein